ncbi:MAG: hypothetical protein JJLCMIEE_01402 [Acidimicrobiales bacterium]|nr:MAG: hypothetical protein EDR02_17535 [Actinomycetota bacterium]MBV6508342.1 hypothetical protein [Acidimicrobiales bacterium]RIK07122.1 MAG: hypothetical protein DCC48_04840 [Acidobacteriota bacterium]
MSRFAHRSFSGGPGAELLGRLIAEIDTLVPTTEPVLVGVTRAATHDPGSAQFDPRRFPAGPRGAAHSMLGFCAPPHWDAVVAVLDGKARSLDGGNLPGHTGPVRSYYLLDREARACSAIESERGSHIDLSGGHEPVGVVVDACHRALGLACAHESRTTLHLLAAVWLNAIVVAATDPDLDAGLSCWRGVAALHPAAASPTGGGGRFRPLTPERLASVAVRAALRLPFESIRTRCAHGDWPMADLSPTEAAWMDEAMFARWVLGAYPPLQESMADLESLCDPLVVDIVTAMLTAWGLTYDDAAA